MVGKEQPDEAQKGEVEFRRKLVEQETVGCASHIDGTLTLDEHDSLMARRMEDTAQDIGRLVSKGIAVSPYIELGAERGQRALAMENDLRATGIATDLSYHMLSSTGRYAKLFGRPKLPMRVCGDAYRLPILSNSLAFAFTYATLHHFPDPTPIVAEIHRVLAPGGCFFFADEPYKCELHVDLYSVRQEFRDQTRDKGRLKRVIERHFARRVTVEEAYSIIENDRIPLKHWRRALGVFPRRDVALTTVRMMRAPLDWRADPIRYTLAYLCGGGISGHCFKAGELPRNLPPINEIIACPSCLEAGAESRLDVRESSSTCAQCHREYAVAEGVVMALPEERMESLYPELTDQRQR